MALPLNPLPASTQRITVVGLVGSAQKGVVALGNYLVDSHVFKACSTPLIQSTIQSKDTVICDLVPNQSNADVGKQFKDLESLLDNPSIVLASNQFLNSL